METKAAKLENLTDEDLIQEYKAVFNNYIHLTKSSSIHTLHSLTRFAKAKNLYKKFARELRKRGIGI